MLAFYFLATIVILLGVLSLRSGFSFADYVRKELKASPAGYFPFASIIAPCRGIEAGLKDNLEPLFRQDYPEYEVIFVVDAAEDPAAELIKKAIADAGYRIPSRLVVAGEAFDSGQKVHNLRVAVEKVDPRSEVLVFVDSDVRPDREWLKQLVAPLAANRVGAATGYRWFVGDGFTSQLRSVWNASIASALGSNTARNFCWGGSTAIRRATFDQLRVRDAWQGTVSDDFAVTRVLQAAKLPIHFVPRCLVRSDGEGTLGDLIEFTNRQLKITRNYAPHLWKPLLIGSLLFNLAFWGGIILVTVRAMQGLSFWFPLAMVALIFALGAAKAFVRLRAVSSALPGSVDAKAMLAHVLLWPIASALFLWNAVVAGFSRRIVWRGITYELKSANEAVIIRTERNAK